jgi:hypothetical protein
MYELLLRLALFPAFPPIPITGVAATRFSSPSCTHMD